MEEVCEICGHAAHPSPSRSFFIQFCPVENCSCLAGAELRDKIYVALNLDYDPNWYAHIY